MSKPLVYRAEDGQQQGLRRALRLSWEFFFFGGGGVWADFVIVLKTSAVCGFRGCLSCSVRLQVRSFGHGGPKIRVARSWAFRLSGGFRAQETP